MKAYTIKLILKASIVISAFLFHIWKYLVVVGIAVSLDVFIAVWTAIKLHGWEAYDSKRMKDTVAKSGIYFGAILLAHGIDIAFEVDFILRTAAFYILLTEVKSIDEKYYVLYKKSLFKWLIESLPNMNKQKDKNNGRS